MLKRHERVRHLLTQGLWTEGQTVFGLPKIKQMRMKARKAAKEKEGTTAAGGVTEGAETIAVFVLICLFPDWFDVIAWAFGGLCWLTTATRVFRAVDEFGS